MKRIDEEQILEMHTMLISATGGTDGVRDAGLIKSALNSPFQTFMGEELYETAEKRRRCCVMGS